VGWPVIGIGALLFVLWLLGVIVAGWLKNRRGR